MTDLLVDKPKINPITNVEEGLYHVYYDTGGFEYKIILTRVNHGARLVTERYTMIVSRCSPLFFLNPFLCNN